ncbi:Flagellar M-ring protein [Austwickia sp. TVS 96-490-7B]|uniref:flagellar basal-body MS-ring/collar protein FliF n=1 Tax=Austwickia sp. TVS 96-490-7B TaxID=2830843 RepID=UPI001D738C93|nr:flagellar basal-body MS-ring/collar protein FliF [Austwickia sp. TVS 96-490-7B]MBW3083936.1 Flagellar M-ring protein [Austwickia sp. TVS 96-490-7B]
MKNNVKLQAVVGRAKSVFNGFTPGQRAVTIIAVVVAVVGMVVFANWSSKPTMTPIFTNLSAADASAITTKLQETGVPYELGDGSKSVLVPADKANQARLDLAAAKLPQNSPDSAGYAMLDKQSLGSSDFQQKLSAKRAYEGELAKTIKKIDKVQDANVYLALGEDSPYTDNQTKPSASVQVTMANGSKLKANQVDAITYLVSSAVPKMDPHAVTVTDSTGQRYTDTDGGAGLDQRADQIRAVSAAKTAELQRFLDTIVGPGNSTVSVQAELNFDNTKINRQEYVLAKPGDPPLAEQHSTEKMTGAGGQAVGGVLGPDNITVPGLGQGNANSQYTKEDFTRQNPYGTITTTTDAAKGSIKKLDVAVALDVKNAGAYNATDLTDLLSRAAGIDTNRGDLVKVSKLAFDTKAADAAKSQAEAEAAAARQEQLLDLAKNAGLVLLLLVALFIGFRRSRKREEVVDLGELPSASPQAALPPTPTDPPLEYQLESDLLPVIEATPVDPQSAARVLAREEIGNLVEEDPDEVARLLRGWISERN